MSQLIGRAMTLVEVLAVVVILGLISGMLFVGFSGSFGMAKHELAKSQIGVIQSQLEKYRLDKGAWPGNDVGLAALSDGHGTPSDAFYLNPGQIVDPWNRTYMYVTPGPAGHPYELLTYGADGEVGGQGEDADISSVNLRSGD